MERANGFDAAFDASDLLEKRKESEREWHPDSTWRRRKHANPHDIAVTGASVWDWRSAPKYCKQVVCSILLFQTNASNRVIWTYYKAPARQSSQCHLTCSFNVGLWRLCLRNRGGWIVLSDIEIPVSSVVSLIYQTGLILFINSKIP